MVDTYTITYSNGTTDTFTITNRYTPDKTSKKVIKKWEDNNNQDGLRTENVKVVFLMGVNKNVRFFSKNTKS